VGVVRGVAVRPPDGTEAMKETLRPVTAFGFERTLRVVIDSYILARKNGDLRQEFGGYAKIMGEMPWSWRNTSSEARVPRQQDPDVYRCGIPDACRARSIRMGRQAPAHVPIRFHNVKLNAGLTEKAFVPEANEMTEPN